MPFQIMLSTIFDDLLAAVETKSFFLFYLLCKFRFKFFRTSDIRRYQRRRAKRIAAYATTHSAFFKNLYAGIDPGAFSSLPTVNKKIMMDHLTEYNTVGLTKNEILDFCLEVERTKDFSKRLKGFNVGMSSGTSGNKGVEIVSLEEETYMKAAFFARFDFPKHEKMRLAFILRVSTPAFSFNRFGHSLTYVSQLNPSNEIIRQLEAIQPTVVSAPPSMLKLIAREVETGTCAIHPKRLVSYAEILYPDVKEYLAKVFSCAVHEVYKCTEGPIAISCRHGRLHINEDLVLIETLNRNGTVTPPGQPCQKLIVTDLHKTSQPIIRYELNDIITVSTEACPCGSSFRVIERIQGRSDDLFWAKHAETGEWQYIFPDYISRAIITASDDIDEYQAVQNAPDNVLVRIQLRPGISHDHYIDKAVADNITAVFAHYRCVQPNVSIVFGLPEPNSN
ncbi:MAG: F390 synthetase-related protein, partial [Candidatus Shapirobacteria bacterium]